MCTGLQTSKPAAFCAGGGIHGAVAGSLRAYKQQRSLTRGMRNGLPATTGLT